MKDACKNGHSYTEENLRFNSKGYYYCLICLRQSQRNWMRRNLQSESVKRNRRENMKRKVKQLRLEANEAYGGKCVCCGESTPEFLHLDHVNNDGAEHRRELSGSSVSGGSIQTLRWAKKNNWPDKLQLKCHNCGLAEAFYERCPHENSEDY